MVAIVSACPCIQAFEGINFGLFASAGEVSHIDFGC